MVKFSHTNSISGHITPITGNVSLFRAVLVGGITNFGPAIALAPRRNAGKSLDTITRCQEIRDVLGDRVMQSDSQHHTGTFSRNSYNVIG